MFVPSAMWQWLCMHAAWKKKQDLGVASLYIRWPLKSNPVHSHDFFIAALKKYSLHLQPMSSFRRPQHIFHWVSPDEFCKERKEMFCHPCMVFSIGPCLCYNNGKTLTSDGVVCCFEQPVSWLAHVFSCFCYELGLTAQWGLTGALQISWSVKPKQNSFGCGPHWNKPMACNFSVIYARRGKNPNEIVGILVSAANNTNRQVLFYFAFVTKVPAAGAVLVIWITTCASSLHCAEDETSYTQLIFWVFHFMVWVSIVNQFCDICWIELFPYLINPPSTPLTLVTRVCKM